jgi:hypothetical protein
MAMIVLETPGKDALKLNENQPTTVTIFRNISWSIYATISRDF